jgi:hypothetical protein
MNTKHLSQLPQLFRGPFLRKVAVGHYYKELSERLATAGLTDLLKLRLGDIFQSVYEVLLQQYRCEYVFKNALTQKWFLSRHSMESSFVTDEFRVGENRVDLAVFSKTSVAFEIKTEFDSAARLPSQSLAYMKVFDLVYIVTTSTMLPKLEDWIPKTVGVLELRDAGNFKTVRSSESHANQTDLTAAFNCLRQSERISIVEQISKRKVEVPNSRVYTECKRRFRSLLPFEAQDHVVQHIRKRPYSAASVTLMREAPEALKHAALTLRATNQEIKQIMEELKTIPQTKTQNKKDKDDEHIFSVSEREARGTVCVENAC